MKYEYLIFNLIVLSGPIFFGLQKKFYFFNYWKEALISIVIAAIPFLIWDVQVTGKHWFFAEEYVLSFNIINLPFEEILFFISVPFACLFTWQMIKKFSKNINDDKRITKNQNHILTLIVIVFMIIGIITMQTPKEYTTLASLFFASSILIDKRFGANIFLKKYFGYYMLLVTIFTLIFNGYLTWRPVVTYNPIYQLDFRIFTIPIEDFFFGFALIIIATTIFEKLINRKYA